MIGGSADLTVSNLTKWSGSKPISGLPSSLVARGQGGLMDVVLHPQYADNGWVVEAPLLWRGNTCLDPEGGNPDSCDIVEFTPVVFGQSNQIGFVPQEVVKSAGQIIAHRERIFQNGLPGR